MGTVRKRKSGNEIVYQGIVRVVGHPHRYETFKTSKDAKKWVRDVETEIEQRDVTDPKILIDDLIDQYVREIAPKRGLAPSHLKHDIPSVRSKFKGMRMSDLQGRGLIDWATQQGMGATSRAWHIARLRGVLRQAEHHWGIVIPWKDIDAATRKMRAMGTLSVGRERDRRCSPAEMAAIKKALVETREAAPARNRGKHDWANIFDFCLASAMRIAEVARITWADFDEVKRTVIIRDRKHPTKKMGNHKLVPLLNGAFECLMKQPRRGERIFPICSLYASRIFKAAAEAAGVKDIVLHDLRHEGVSRLFELGFAIEEVVLVSGHTDWSVLRRYTHLQPASLVDKERRLRAMWSAN